MFDERNTLFRRKINNRPSNASTNALSINAVFYNVQQIERACIRELSFISPRKIATIYKENEEENENVYKNVFLIFYKKKFNVFI